jgi:diguanylate cyclase (GGDEF)-like protein
MKNILSKILLSKPKGALADDLIDNKVIFLHNGLILMAVVTFVMGMVRWQDNYLMSVIDFVYTLIGLCFAKYIRAHQEQIEHIASTVLAVYFILIYAIYLEIPKETTRVLVLFLLIAIAYFLKGRWIGTLWGIFVLVTIIIANMLPWFNTNYSHFDVLASCMYLIVLLYILYNYELEKEQNMVRLKHLNENLEHAVMVRTNELQKANKKLNKLNQQKTSAIKKISLVEQEESLLNKLNRILQLCASMEEIYPRVSIIAQELFPDLSGGLVIYHHATKKMETVIQWGDEPILQTFFSPEECFALRWGNIITVNDPAKVVPCTHYTSPPQGGYIAIPLFVQQELIGLIHLNSHEIQKISKHVQVLATTFSDIVKIALVNIKLRLSLEELSVRDPLTNLYNRRYLIDFLPRELSRIKREDSNLIVVMMDIDDFKKINDQYGHEAGDEVLQLIGQALNDSFRANDMACRFGGEEFLVVMSNVDIKISMQRLEKFCELIKNKTITYQEQALSPITFSIGIAQAPEHGLSVDQLIEAADRALYLAKHSGKAKIELFHHLPDAR